MNRIDRMIAAVVLLTLAGCASIQPKRIIPCPSDPVKHGVAGCTEYTAKGLRYYETRPFIIVRAPFPISSTPYLVQGVLQPDGRNFIVTHAPTGLELPTGRMIQLPSVPRQGAADRPSREKKAQAEAVPPDTEASAPAAQDATSDADSSACEKGEESGKCADSSGQRMGYSNVSMETDLTANALFPVNDLFSITYLPDYDREFVVETRGRWGLSRLHLVRGPGGVLLGFNATVDNSAVIKPLMDAWQSVLKASTKAIEVSLVPAAQGESVISQNASTSAEKIVGTATTLRLYRVRYAVPGVYPLLKSPEIVAYGGKTQLTLPSSTFPYEVPYRYTEVYLAEPLLDPAGGSRMVADVVSRSASSGPGEATDTKSGAAVNCSQQKQLQASVSKAALQSLLAQIEGIEVVSDTIVGEPVVESDGKGCAERVTFAVDLPAADLAKVEAALTRKFSSTTFVVTAKE